MNVADERLATQNFSEEAMEVYNRIGAGPSVAVGTRTDPYGEMADVMPVTIRNAGLLLREAQKSVDATELAYKNARQVLNEVSKARDLAKNDLIRAEHRLKISAMQPNGGEAEPAKWDSEAAAKALYETWSRQPQYIPWVNGGNSIMQDKARRLVSKQDPLYMGDA